MTPAVVDGYTVTSSRWRATSRSPDATIRHVVFARLEVEPEDADGMAPPPPGTRVRLIGYTTDGDEVFLLFSSSSSSSSSFSWGGRRKKRARQEDGGQNGRPPVTMTTRRVTVDNTRRMIGSTTDGDEVHRMDDLPPRPLGVSSLPTMCQHGSLHDVTCPLGEVVEYDPSLAMMWHIRISSLNNHE